MDLPAVLMPTVPVMLVSILVLFLLPSGQARQREGSTRLSTERATDRLARRAELAAFLRARRERLRPAHVGLPDGSASGRRRTPGLRREEVAQLSGVGVTWYTWLEQGRAITASDQVVDALARALVLTPGEHRHLRQLAGLTTPDRESPADSVLPRLQRLVDAVTPNLAFVYDIHLDYLVWNAAYVRVRYDPGQLPTGRRNLLWMMFTDERNRSCMERWEPAARAMLSEFRAMAGQRPGDPRFAELVTALAEASPDFAAWWAEYPVSDFEPVTIKVDHPRAGPIALELFELRLAEHPDLLMCLQAPATSDDLQRVRSLLGDR